jgi:two-component system NtrC family sensor kinase
MRISLKAKLVISFLVVTVICGLIATLVSIRLISTGIINQAQEKVKIDLNSARQIYREESEHLKDVIRFTALRFFIKDAFGDKDVDALQKELKKIREAESLDILTLTDKNGRVIIRTRNPSVTGDNQAQDELVSRVLSSGEVISGTVIILREELLKEVADLAEQTYIKFIRTEMEKPSSETEQTSGMIIKAAAPISGYNDSLLGALYGGNLLNRNYKIVDEVKRTV